MYMTLTINNLAKHILRYRNNQLNIFKLASVFTATSIPDDESLVVVNPAINLAPGIAMQFTRMIFPQIEQAQDACVAILGGGGKTSLLHRLGSELAHHFPRVLITALTKSARHTEHDIFLLNDLLIDKIPAYFDQSNPLCIMGSEAGPDKLSGISTADLAHLWKMSDCTIFEADGARNLPLKAHLPHDPVVPAFANHVIILVGADVVNTTLTDGKIHRPDVFQEKWSIMSNTVLDADFIASVLTSPKGYHEKIQHPTQGCYFVNKGDHYPEAAKELARAIRKQTDEPVFWGSVQGDFMEAIK